MIEVETFVSRTLRPFASDRVEDYWSESLPSCNALLTGRRNYDGTAPTHFFGELTKTPEGCLLLRHRGIVSDFAEIVRLHGMEANDQTILTNVKSVLWALVSLRRSIRLLWLILVQGSIGSTVGGLPFLEDEEIIEVIIEIAEHSPVLTMRG